jgi:hypothetical protein
MIQVDKIKDEGIQKGPNIFWLNERTDGHRGKWKTSLIILHT